MACRLIINADDFGWSEGVNEAVYALHRDGIVTSSSLMIGAPAASDALRRLADCPNLAVGLHVSLILAQPLLPPALLPRVVDRDGWLPADPLLAGLAYTYSRVHRAEWQREMEAQFKAFDRLGIGWSHVDAHVHFSLTPAVFRDMMCTIRRYPVQGFRIPEDDYRLYQRLDPKDAARQIGLATWFAYRCRVQRRALQGSAYRIPERCYGLFRSGRLDEPYLEALVLSLPEGDLELHCHPDLSTPHGQREFEALRSRAFRAALRKRGVILSTYVNLGPKT